MKRVLLTFAVGPHVPYLEIALPSFLRYANLHRYDLLVTECRSEGRPPSWGKIPAMLAALQQYDQVLWLDADCFIVDPREDLAALLPEGASQALVAWNREGSEPIPNCGVWLVTRAMEPILKAIWDNQRWIKHCWWEQAALIDLMGFEVRNLKIQRTRASELYGATHFLPLVWNASVEHEIPHSKIRHATKTQDRIGHLRKWSEQVLP